MEPDLFDPESLGNRIRESQFDRFLPRRSDFEGHCGDGKLVLGERLRYRHPVLDHDGFFVHRSHLHVSVISRYATMRYLKGPTGSGRWHPSVAALPGSEEDLYL